MAAPVERINFLEATTPGKKPASVQVKANKRHGRVLVPGTNGKGHMLQTYTTLLEGRTNKGNLNLPNAAKPSTGTYSTKNIYGPKKGGKRRKTTRRRRTRKH